MTTPLLLTLLTFAAVEPPPDQGQVTLASREWTLVLDGARAWALHHVDYQGTLVAHDKGCQSPCLDAGGGWIGGPLHDGGYEQCLELTFEVDGETCPFELGRTYQGATVTARRVSMLDQLKATETIVVTDDRVTFKSELEATATQPVSQLYGFLMNWEPRFDRWAALKQNGSRVDGTFTNSKARYVSATTAWSGLYDSAAKQGFVTWSTTTPDYQAGAGGTNYWDQPNYHKQILSLMGKGELPAGTRLQCEVLLAGFTAEPDAWIAKAADLAGVTVEPQTAPLPTTLTVMTRDWTVTFDQTRGWTIQKTAYRGQSASHQNGFHGAVINTGVPLKEGTTAGWIGTGHTEGGQEQVSQVAFQVDGQPYDLKNGDTVKASAFVLDKDSMIGALRHHATITVSDDRIVEHHTFEATAEQKVVTMYAFMHCWEPSFDQYLAQPVNGDDLLSGSFDNANDNEISQDVRWSAIYDSGRGLGMVTAYPEAYLAHDGGKGTFYWDRSNYHKQYLNVWGPGTIPAGTQLDYTLSLQGFTAAAGDWQTKAAALAASAF